MAKGGPALLSAWAFLRQFMRNPREVGAIFPSSQALGKAMLSGLDLGHMHLVVEYGPGTGVFTSLIKSRLPEGAAYLAFELNDSFHKHLQRQWPSIYVIRDKAAHVSRYLNDGQGQVDLVISGLPFAAMPWPTVAQTIRETAQVLKPGGEFRTFVYGHSLWLPNGKRLAPFLRTLFSVVEIITVVRNVPPALVIRCRK